MREVYGKSLATSSDPSLCSECGDVIEDGADLCDACHAAEERARIEDEEMDRADRAADEANRIERETSV